MITCNFISQDEQKNLILWAENEECRLKPNGYQRFCNTIKNLSDNKLVYEIREKIIERFNLHNCKEELLGDWLGMVKNGGQVHIHTDRRDYKEHHRFNVLIQLPEKGGVTIYDNKELPIKERTLSYYRPDLYEHGTTKVIGNKPRINLSFGFLRF